jgi:hypothetical protein
MLEKFLVKRRMSEAELELSMKRLEAANIFCDLLEHEWKQGDGMPVTAEVLYRRACELIRRESRFRGEEK